MTVAHPRASTAGNRFTMAFLKVGQTRTPRAGWMRAAQTIWLVSATLRASTRYDHVATLPSHWGAFSRRI